MIAPLGSTRIEGLPAVSARQALEFVDVHQTYPTTSGEPVVALEGIGFTIDAGSFVTLVGPSGCGKSTLLQLAAGFLTPTSGEIRSFGSPVRRPGADRGVVFQQATSLLPWLTVRKNVELGLRYAGVGKGERRLRAEQELARVGLLDFADRAVYELSGGMQQRTQIARVLANDPQLMLMDEPSGALDALTREHLQTELLGIWRAARPTVLLITHSVEEAVALGTRVIVMSARPGSIVLDEPQPFAARAGSNDDIRAEPDFVAACHRVRGALGHGDT
jgi:taurine transport system ATP-binding protein